jgi:NADH pyrophosphatase NudC (nudix superfamily)
MKTDDKELKPQWEVQDAKWFPLDEVLKNINYKNLKETTENAVREIKNSIVYH